MRSSLATTCVLFMFTKQTVHRIHQSEKHTGMGTIYTTTKVQPTGAGCCIYIYALDQT